MIFALFAISIVCCIGNIACQLDPTFGYTKISRCEFPGDLTVSGAVTGGTVFLREKTDGTVEIYGEISGLDDGEHGIHIHEFGGLGNNCVDAGGHFDPAMTEEGDNGLYVGNLGSIQSANQVGVYRMDNTEINLSKQDDCDVSDLAIVVHADPTGGARVGCCTITEVSFSYTKTAICDFPGNLTGAGTVTGGTIFLREKLDGTVEVFGEVSGLTDGDHGIHIHENGGLGNSCVDAGGHFDPDSTEVGDNGLYAGNLGSITSYSGVGVYLMDSDEINLSNQDDYDVLNLAMVVHENPTGGARVGCCAITESNCFTFHEFLNAFGYSRIARCEFPGNMTVSGAVTGGTVFLREKLDGTVEIYGEINGLDDGNHGIHIHEFGGLGNNCTDAGGHFDPDSTEVGDNGLYAGNLGSITSSSGVGIYTRDTTDINLSKQDDYDVSNLAMVVHADPTGGARVGCCAITEWFY